MSRKIQRGKEPSPAPGQAFGRRYDILRHLVAAWVSIERLRLSLQKALSNPGSGEPELDCFGTPQDDLEKAMAICLGLTPNDPDEHNFKIMHLLERMSDRSIDEIMAALAMYADECSLAH